MKNIESLIDPIFDIIHTQKELEFLLLSLRNLKKNISKTSRKRKISSLFKQLPSDLVIPMQESWQNYQKTNDEADLNGFIDEVEKQLLSQNGVQLSLAFQPTQIQAELICDWLRTKLENKQIIIKIKFDLDLVAGCILEYQGKRYDLTVASQISNYVN